MDACRSQLLWGRGRRLPRPHLDDIINMNDEQRHNLAVVSRESMESQHPLAVQAIEKYLEWLNLWEDDNRKQFPNWSTEPFTIDSFFSWGETEVLGVVEWGSWLQWKHYVIRAGFGDDGGPATLFATFRRFDPEDDEDEWSLASITQEFDTMFQLIFETNEGPKFHSTPEEKR